MTDNALIKFNNDNFGNVRALLIDGEPWFVGKDVAKALGYKRERDALKQHVPDKYKKLWQITTSGQRRNVTLINEAGLYKLIFASKLPSAEKFSDWVCEDVMPTLRKTVFCINEAWIKQLAQKLAESVASTQPQTKCVYILKMSNESVKIGVTGNFRQRARAIETGSSLSVIDWCHTEYLPSEVAYSIEAECHKIFANCKIQGEFFDATFTEVKTELSNFAEITESKNL